MAYTFDNTPYRPSLRLYTLLTSRGLVFSLLVVGVAAAVTFGVGLIAGDAADFWLGLSLLGASTTACLALLFFFALTYVPYHLPHRRDEQLLPDFDLLLHLRHISVLNNSAALPEIFAALLATSHTQDFLQRLEISADDFAAAFSKEVLPNFSASELFSLAADSAGQLQHRLLTVAHCVAACLLAPAARGFLRRHDLTEKDILFALWWRYAVLAQHRATQRWWEASHLLAFSGIGLQWASGFTPFIDRFAHVPAGNAWDELLGHETQTAEVINGLARSRQSNVLIVGQPGVGRLGIVKEVARRIRANSAHPALNGERVVYIHVGELLALAGNGPEQLAVISRGLSEMERAGNIIAILDGVGVILGRSGENRLNLTDIILPFLNSPQVRACLIMSRDEYRLRVRDNEELTQLFEVVEVEAASPKQTLQLLSLNTPRWEKIFNLFIPYKVLRAAVRETATVMPLIPFPEKAFDIIEEALADASRNHATVLDQTRVEAIISQKVGVPIGRLRGEERERLLNLEALIHRRVVNQQPAVEALVRAMIRARAGVRNDNRPIGTFLFLGPTGVGKTETAKALAEAYFGAESYLQRLDMSEYQGASAVARLIGDINNQAGQLTSLIAEHPFTVLLLDEFEKADAGVLQLFLQVLDEGRLTDAAGQTYVFNHAIIIATSNAGAEFIRERVARGTGLPADFGNEVREHILQANLLRPELLNRFDGVITFTPLTPEHIKQVAELMLNKLNQRLDEKHGITVAITPALLERLGQLGYDPQFGARPMNRAIQDTVEHAVAQKILRQEVSPGQQIQLTI